MKFSSKEARSLIPRKLAASRDATAPRELAARRQVHAPGKVAHGPAAGTSASGPKTALGTALVPAIWSAVDRRAR